MVRSHKKRGMMGIETLIIFIAMIIVAAIAAGVLLRTQGLLQQRALATGNEARERLATGVEVVSIVANSNNTAHTINELELAVRLRAGSGDVQIKTVGVTATSRNFAANAILQNSGMPDYKRQNFTWLNSSNTSTTFDYDYTSIERRNGKIRLVFDNESPDNLSGLEIYTTRYHFVFPLGINFSSTGETVDLEQVPIKEDYTDTYSKFFGFLTLSGTTDGNLWINASDESAAFTDFHIESDVDSCDWSLLVPDARFCFVPRLGNENTIVEQGELLVWRYKLSSDNTLRTEQRVEWRFIPKSGAIEEIVFLTPPVISNQVTSLWP